MVQAVGHDDFREQIEEDLPSAWRPDPGEVLMGTVLRYEQSETSYGPCHVAVVRDEDTEEPVSVWLFSAALLNQFKKWNPQPGERIGLKYAGETVGKSGRKYHDYRLKVQRQTSSPWGAVKQPAKPAETDSPFDETDPAGEWVDPDVPAVPDPVALDRARAEELKREWEEVQARLQAKTQGEELAEVLFGKS